MMIKDISLRPTKVILSLFEQIRKLDNVPNTDRNSIVARSITVALENKNINWQLVATMSIEEDFIGNIPNHVVLKVEEENFNVINEQIKNAFNKEKITIPYTLKLLLVNYLAFLNQPNIAEIQASIPQEIELALFKSEYVGSLYRNKKRLLETCKVYLNSNVSLKKNLNERATRQNKQLTNVYDLSNYFPDLMRTMSTNSLKEHFFPDKRIEFGTPTETYLAKVLAGWFIFMVESQYETSIWNDVLDCVVKNLEDELQIKNESPFEKIRMQKDAETSDYYKNVYARMMSR